jgi:hypothetical protein
MARKIEPSPEVQTDSLSELDRIQATLWESVESLRKAGQYTRLAPLIDQLRKLTNDRVRLLAEERDRAVREAAETREGTERVMGKVVGVLNQWPDARDAVLAALKEGQVDVDRKFN